MHTSPAQLARLRWQCRRGMLELDLLFEQFLERGYAALPVHERDVFQRLLSYPDQDLFEYFFSDRLPVDKDVADVIGRIRRTAAP